MGAGEEESHLDLRNVIAEEWLSEVALERAWIAAATCDVRKLRTESQELERCADSVEPKAVSRGIRALHGLE